MRSVILRVTAWLSGRLPAPVKEAIYRMPGVSSGIRWVLTRAAPAERVEVEVAAGIARGVRLRLNLKRQKYYWLGTHEIPLQQSLAREVRPGMTAYDLGAHQGFFTLAMARLVGPEGRVVSFEPLPENARLLRENLTLNAELARSVSVEAVAVTGRSGRQILYAHADSYQGRVNGPTRRPAGSVEVESITLDDFVYGRGEPPPQVVKIDVEGAEGDVLAGAQRLLTEGRPLWLLEVHGAEAGRKIWEALQAVGYTVRDLHESKHFRSADQLTHGHVLARPR